MSQPAPAAAVKPTEPSEDAWAPYSWRSRPIEQQPLYEDEKQRDAAAAKLKSLPPLVHPLEIDELRLQMAQVARGEKFLLQGGDCAEGFQDSNRASIESKLKILLQMSLVIMWGARMPSVRIGRVAGQYGKPRSSPMEVVDGQQLPSFKGDNINGFEPTPQSRKHDPQRLVLAHFHSACTLNYIRALIKGGYADLHQSKHWDLGYVKNSKHRKEYQGITSRILDSLDFMESCGASSSDAVKTVDFFVSHEGLVLEYEAAMVEAHNKQYYDTSAHFLWIGDRTRDIEGAHIEFFRGIANPVGVKVGPSMKPADLVRLIQRLNPLKEPGKTVLITRLGATQVSKLLPPLIEAVHAAGYDKVVVWSCDPMHGNTHKSSTGIKTRDFGVVLEEVIETFFVHQRLMSRMGGIHLELTGENVTECVGGPQRLSDQDLHINYTTYCDPRLNYSQSMEMAFRLAKLLQPYRPHRRSFATDNDLSDDGEDDEADKPKQEALSPPAAAGSAAPAPSTATATPTAAAKSS